MKKHLLVISIILFYGAIFSQVPEAFRYQAVIRDNVGDVLSDSLVNLKLSFLQDSPTGSNVYSENHSVRTNQFGLVNINVGSGNVLSGDFSAIDWGNHTFFLELSVDITGGNTYILMGATQLLSVPYALYAKNTANVDDADADSLNEIQDLVLENNSLKLSKNPNATLIPLPQGGGASVWDKSGDTVYYNSGNVGIGTHSPNSTLEVVGGQQPSDTLFQVKDHEGNTVFVVMPDGVHVLVPETSLNDSTTSGFIVSGRYPMNKKGDDYLRVTPDSVQIYIKEDGSRSRRRGFLVGGRTSRRSDPVNDLLHVTSDSTRIYVSGNDEAGFKIIEENIQSSLFKLDTNNYFIGHFAGLNTKPVFNQQIGGLSGIQNIYFGYEAGMENTVGTHNVLIGYKAGKKVTENSNVFIGYRAGHSSDNSHSSIGIGRDAAYNNKGEFNVAIGSNAGINNSTGDGNIFIGHGTAMGQQNAQKPGGQLPGPGNPSPDPNASHLPGTLSGDYNVLMGYSSGLFLEHSAQHNTMLGAYSGFKLRPGSSNVFLGYGAGFQEIGSNRLHIDNDTLGLPLIYGEFDNRFVAIDNKLAIGNKNPAYALDVTGDIRATGSIFYGGSQGAANGNQYIKPDYVFKPSYKRLSITEINRFINTNGHLPWVTSAKQEDGKPIDMVKLSFETLETTENLQLQIIELKEENNELKQKYVELLKRLETLEKN